MARQTNHSTHPNALVFETLSNSEAPLSAYTILDALRPQGIKAPPTVYRALETLIAQGKVHKVHELGAYIACNCPPEHAHSLTLLTVCQECKQVEELHDHALMQEFEALRGRGIPLTHNAVIELPITCATCHA